MLKDEEERLRAWPHFHEHATQNLITHIHGGRTVLIGSDYEIKEQSVLFYLILYLLLTMLKHI